MTPPRTASLPSGHRVAAVLLVASIAVAGAGVAVTVLRHRSGAPQATSAYLPVPRGTALRILASTELSDMRPLLADFTAESGIAVTLDLVETREGARRVTEGAATGVYDAVWFSSERDIRSRESTHRWLGSGTPIMTSPVTLGLRPEVATRLGWAGRVVTWEQIAHAEGLSLAMAAPEQSDLGRLSILAAAAGLTGRGGMYTDPDLDRADPGLRSFFHDQAFTAADPVRLSEAFAGAQGADVDGLLSFESEILHFAQTPDAGGPRPSRAAAGLPPRLVPVRIEGTIAATYALTPLWEPRSPPGPDAVAALTRYLLTSDVQRRILRETHRVPVIPGVGLPPWSAGRPVPRWQAPADDEVVTYLIGTYLNRYRRPACTVYVLDTSGSMKHHGRMEDLQKAMRTLTAGGTATAEHPERLRGSEEVVLVSFATTVREPVVVRVPEHEPGAALHRLTTWVQTLQPGGRTAVYDGLRAGLGAVAHRAPRAPERITTIVLVTDGARNGGITLDAFLRYRRTLGDLREVPVFPVLVGEAEKEPMEALALATGGRVLDARQGDLAVTLQELRLMR